MKDMKQNMKRFINIFICLSMLVCAAASCQKEDAGVNSLIDQSLVGEWRLKEVTAEGTDVYKNIDIYLCINPDGSFELFQKSGTQTLRFNRYIGTCKSEEGILTGEYKGGIPWGSRYIYDSSVSDRLVLKSYNLIEEQKYVRESIPAEVRENADTITKAYSSDTTPIL